MNGRSNYFTANFLTPPPPLCRCRTVNVSPFTWHSVEFTTPCSLNADVTASPAPIDVRVIYAGDFAGGTLTAQEVIDLPPSPATHEFMQVDNVTEWVYTNGILYEHSDERGPDFGNSDQESVFLVFVNPEITGFTAVTFTAECGALDYLPSSGTLSLDWLWWTLVGLVGLPCGCFCLCVCIGICVGDDAKTKKNKGSMNVARGTLAEARRNMPVNPEGYPTNEPPKYHGSDDESTESDWDSSESESRPKSPVYDSDDNGDSKSSSSTSKRDSLPGSAIASKHYSKEVRRQAKKERKAAIAEALARRQSSSPGSPSQREVPSVYSLGPSYNDATINRSNSPRGHWNDDDEKERKAQVTLQQVGSSWDPDAAEPTAGPSSESYSAGWGSSPPSYESAYSNNNNNNTNNTRSYWSSITTPSAIDVDTQGGNSGSASDPSTSTGYGSYDLGGYGDYSSAYGSYGDDYDANKDEKKEDDGYNWSY